MALKLGKLSSLEVMRRKRVMIQLRKVVKIYRRLHGGGRGGVPALHYINVCKRRSYIFISFQQITFKLGNFANLKALFTAQLTNFPKRVHVKN